MAKVDPQSLVSNASTSSLLTDLRETYETASTSTRESLFAFNLPLRSINRTKKLKNKLWNCLLYTSDAADDYSV